MINMSKPVQTIVDSYLHNPKLFFRNNRFGAKYFGHSKYDNSFYATILIRENNSEREVT